MQELNAAVYFRSPSLQNSTFITRQPFSSELSLESIHLSVCLSVQPAGREASLGRHWDASNTIYPHIRGCLQQEMIRAGKKGKKIHG